MTEIPCANLHVRYSIVDICQIRSAHGRKTRKITPCWDHPRISRLYPRRPCQRRRHRYDSRRARGPAPMRPGRPQSGGSRPEHGHCPRHGGGNLQSRASQGGKRVGQWTGGCHRGRQYRILPHHHDNGRMASKGGRHHEGGNDVRQRQHLYALWPQRTVQDLRHPG